MLFFFFFFFFFFYCCFFFQIRSRLIRELGTTTKYDTNTIYVCNIRSNVNMSMNKKCKLDGNIGLGKRKKKSI